MTTVLIVGGIVAVAVILGAYLRWPVRPVVVGYRIGVTMGRQFGAKQADRDSAPVFEVAAAWLMPWRAAARIRVQQQDMTILIRALAYAVTGTAGPLMRERPDRSAWYDRPLPVAVLAALLRPARAVRKLRSSDDAIAYTLDAILAQERKHQEAGELAAISK